MKAEPAGAFSFVLHSHIPYVLAHGRWPHGMDWLSEVAAETYIPLLDILNRLVAEGIRPAITLGLTPVLADQLADPTFASEFLDYLTLKLETARANQAQFKADGNMHLLGLAHYWEDFYTHVQNAFVNTYGSDLVGAFRLLQDAGQIEIITSAATHGYLPLLLTDECVQAQVRQGVQTYRHHFGKDPRGFWLPECAYRPRYLWNAPLEPFRSAEPVIRKGVEEFLAESGLSYFFIDAHLLKGGRAVGVYADRFSGLTELWSQFAKEYVPETRERSPYQPYLVNSSGGPLAPVAAFSRDARTGAQVWSGDHGYPGDPAYLEFHKKHYPGNLRYWRVSTDKADLTGKELYQPFEAGARVREHARHFAALVREVLADHRTETGTAGFITAMYDTELFGHWWFEGPQFLYEVIKALSGDGQIELATCAEYLDASPPHTVVSLPEGSWGEGGYHWIWLNELTAWTWEHVYADELLMSELAHKFCGVEKVSTLLRQLARELMLLESSDWQFSISTFGSKDYAEQRVLYHHNKFQAIARLIPRVAGGEAISPDEWNILGEAEDRDRCFPDVDPAWWASVEFPAAKTASPA